MVRLRQCERGRHRSHRRSRHRVAAAAHPPAAHASLRVGSDEQAHRLRGCAERLATLCVHKNCTWPRTCGRGGAAGGRGRSRLAQSRAERERRVDAEGASEAPTRGVQASCQAPAPRSPTSAPAELRRWNGGDAGHSEARGSR
eukprot:4014298-Prymnesium_polylepis.2